eukprot:443589-Pelagomonas_calceolata.AAC.1
MGKSENRCGKAILREDVGTQETFRSEQEKKNYAGSVFTANQLRKRGYLGLRHRVTLHQEKQNKYVNGDQEGY